MHCELMDRCCTSASTWINPIGSSFHSLLVRLKSEASAPAKAAPSICPCHQQAEMTRCELFLPRQAWDKDQGKLNKQLRFSQAWALFERCGLPRLAAFKPSLVFLSCGFDGITGDPTEAETRLTPGWYGHVAAACAAHAPVVATLQGGYLADAVAEAGRGVLAALVGGAGGAADPVAAVAAAAGAGVGEVGTSAGVAALVEAVEGKLTDSEGWWQVEQSFNHGLADEDEDDDDEACADEEDDDE
jgi:hypothetical protein